ncbi:hypothetical protein QWZ03_16005 [Chitinimonas viridis]|uniref:DNA-binding protein n=1 Tax=Chitinimonas viridis TaxID=664880 RepID=A0ABT8B7N4_9NEIS|nr:hypothetical protein [Chitinimonas viridis]MDN3578273.1 hypothetical protein [Chitinimonas viridis]
MAETTFETPEIQALTRELSQELTAEYGPMLGSEALVKVLGYRSSGAFQQALTRGTIPVPVFRIEYRRGCFALTRDVAQWLSRQRATATPAGERQT